MPKELNATVTFAELSPAGSLPLDEHLVRKTIRKIKDLHAGLITSPNAGAFQRVKDFVMSMEQRAAADAALLDTLEQFETPSAAHMEQLRRYDAARKNFLKKEHLFSSADVARRSGSTARNESAKASRWKSEGRIFSVTSGNADRYPAFQFSVESGEPLPIMRAILEVFREMNDWQIALWFAAANAWLGDRRPLDVIHREADAVLDAARHAVEPFDV